MPDHTSWFTYIVSLSVFKNLERGLDGKVFVYPAGTPVTLEYTFLLMFVLLLILGASIVAAQRARNVDNALIPESSLTISSFMENFVETFYGLLRDALGPADAKFFLPIVGTCAVFIFFSNALGLFPGFAPPTSNLNVTLACGLVIFLTTHYYGLKRNGINHILHLLGPEIELPVIGKARWLAPLMLILETISHLVRPVTLGIRLMVNMFVDHLVVAVFGTLVSVVVPLPIMLMGVLVVTVQTYVFCLLSTVYIQLAVEHHDEHEHAHDAHGHDHDHAPATAHAH